jgi:glycosyltransferase involved in cell wall biosynthesis
MRILLWSEPFWPAIGGVERLVVPLVRYLAGRGHEILVVTNQKKARSAPEIDLGGATILRLDMVGALDRRDPAEIVAIQIQIREANKEFAPDIFHLFTAMLSAYFYLQIYRKIDCPILHTEQTGCFQLNSPNSLQRLAMDSADWHSTCSHANARMIVCFFAGIASRLSVIVNGIEVPEGAPDMMPPESAPVLLCLGRHQLKQKGFDVALAAMPAILLRHPGARLVIAGDGPDRNGLLAKVAQLGLSKHVDFPGWVHPDRVQAMIGRCSVMIVPSRFEPFGLVATEAGAASRACIVSNVDGLPEIVEDGVTGRLVPPDDPAAIATVVNELLEAPSTLEAMGRAARVRVERLFRFERFCREYEDLYYRITRSISRQAHER